MLRSHLQMDEIVSRMEALAKKMSLPAYADKTPDNVKAEDLDKKSKLEAEKAAAEAAMADMQKLLASAAS